LRGTIVSTPFAPICWKKQAIARARSNTTEMPLCGRQASPNRITS
jgi:hypothetical protein